MLRPAPATSSFSAHIKDHALVFFLPQPEQQSLWRFDLDALIEHSFRVTGRDGYYFLTLDDLDGNSKMIARFVDKGQAQDILNAIHHALLQNDHVDKINNSTPAYKRWLGWLTFWRFIFLVIAAYIAWHLLLAPSASSPNVPVVNKALQSAPSGVPLDADKMLE